MTKTKRNLLGIVLTLFIVLALPLFITKTFAYTRECTADGYTIVYVNGILTTEKQAKDDTSFFEDIFKRKSGRTDVVFKTGYNQTHAEGLGDKLKSVAQTYLSAGGSDITDYDLKTILINLSSQIHTQKVLLVGHSQGTFYTNAMYDYLVAHGMPASSIAVYNLATPASRVAGGGNYTTSSYDKAIEYVRELDAAANAPQPASLPVGLSRRGSGPDSLRHPAIPRATHVFGQ
jgi:hypothetical protein